MQKLRYTNKEHKKHNKKKEIKATTHIQAAGTLKAKEV